MFKKPLVWILLAGAAVFAFKYAKTAYTASNLQFLLKNLRFKVIDVFTSALQIDLSLYNSSSTAITFNNINAEVYYNNLFVGFIAYNSNQLIAPNSYSNLNFEVLINNLTAGKTLLTELKKLINSTSTPIQLKISGTITANGKVLPLIYETVFNQNKVSGINLNTRLI